MGLQTLLIPPFVGLIRLEFSYIVSYVFKSLLFDLPVVLGAIRVEHCFRLNIACFIQIATLAYTLLSELHSCRTVDCQSSGRIVAGRRRDKEGAHAADVDADAICLRHWQRVPCDVCSRPALHLRIAPRCGALTDSNLITDLYHDFRCLCFLSVLQAINTPHTWDRPCINHNCLHQKANGIKNDSNADHWSGILGLLVCVDGVVS